MLSAGKLMPEYANAAQRHLRQQLPIASNKLLRPTRHLVLLCIALVLTMGTVQAAHACIAGFEEQGFTADRGVLPHVPCALCMTPHAKAPIAHAVTSAWAVLDVVPAAPLPVLPSHKVPFALLVRPPPRG